MLHIVHETTNIVLTMPSIIPKICMSVIPDSGVVVAMMICLPEYDSINP